MIANTHKPTQLDAACAFIPDLRRALAALPSDRWANRAAYDLRVAELAQTVIRAGGATADKWNGATIRLHGFRATSTSGLASACQNWIAQVTLKAAAAAMERQSA